MLGDGRGFDIRGWDWDFCYRHVGEAAGFPVDLHPIGFRV